MKFDIALPNCMEGFLVPANFAGPAELVRFAQDAERLGYYALWGFDFTAPVADLRGPPSDDAEPNWYELMISLASISGVTKTIKLGAGVVSSLCGTPSSWPSSRRPWTSSATGGSC